MDIAQGGDLSSVVAPWRQASYELQNGEVVDLYRWYKTSWVDLKLTWFSPVTPQWGVLWGVSTDERGPSRFRQENVGFSGGRNAGVAA